MEFKDYYAILGVTPQTPIDEIKKAYRKLARKYHPDVSKLPGAEAKFKEINEAWEVLEDPQKRKQYDQLRSGGGGPHPHRGFAGQPQDFSSQTGEDFSDFFNSIFGHRTGRGASSHPKKGEDLHVTLDIPLTRAYQGGVETLQLQTVGGYEEGKVSPHTKQLQVKIPVGVTNGSQIRLKGQGGEGTKGAPSGDLYITLHLQKHPLFLVHQKDIQLKLPITPWEAALGASISVPTLGGEVSVKVPANAQSEQKLRLKGRGLPGDPPGDQYVILQIKVPPANTEKAVQLYQEMAKLMPFNPRESGGM